MTQPCNTGRENLVSAEQSTYYKLFMSKKKLQGLTILIQSQCQKKENFDN